MATAEQRARANIDNCATHEALLTYSRSAPLVDRLIG
jgi:hypothetical protein